jgi:hypothetical protein
LPIRATTSRWSSRSSRGRASRNSFCRDRAVLLAVLLANDERPAACRHRAGGHNWVSYSSSRASESTCGRPVKSRSGRLFGLGIGGCLAGPPGWLRGLALDRPACGSGPRTHRRSRAGVVRVGHLARIRALRTVWSSKARIRWREAGQM